MDTHNPHPELNDPARGPLIEQLNNLLDGEPVSVEAWAFVWLCDIAKLTHLVENFSMGDRLTFQ